MEYLLMICDEETQQTGPGDPGFEEIMAGYNAFTEMVEKLGLLRGSARLLPTSSATTVRVRDGKTLTTDGPFAETKEVLAGFFLIECADLDEALDWAKRIPSARIGSVEVRPIWEPGEYMS